MTHWTQWTMRSGDMLSRSPGDPESISLVLVFETGESSSTGCQAENWREFATDS